MSDLTSNEQRASYAAEVLNGSPHYEADDPTGIQDLLSDLRHLCQAKEWNFTEILRVATDNFNAEEMDVELQGRTA